MTTATTRAPARLLLPAEQAGPDNPRWHELRRRTDEHGWSVTASEIPAVLGLDPWTSPFSLWWQKKQGWATEDNQHMLVGRVLEAGVLALFQRARSDRPIIPGGLYAHPDRPWQMATPDAIGWHHPAGPSCDDGLPEDCGCPAVTVQAKTCARMSDDWGPEGTDEIPVNYRAQVLWEMDTYGCRLGYLAVLFLQDKTFRWYLIQRDDRDIHVMVTRAEQFRASLDDDMPPPVDGHPSTLTTVKALHPDLVDTVAEIPAPLAAAYRRGLALAKRVKAVNDRTEARLRDAMGPARIASCDGLRVASRSVYPHHISGKPVDKLTPSSARRSK